MLMKKSYKKSSGFTFVELLAALAINLILFAGLITIFLTNVNHYKNSISNNRLNQQLQTAITLMSNEIRRAGYWSNAQNDLGSPSNNNPYMASGTDITIGAGNTCILFAYDSNSNGSLPAISSSSDDERYGYRLNGQTLQARPYGAAFNCAAAASAWENITDSNIIQITALTFTLNSSTILTGPGNKGLVQRSVDISITGRLTTNTAVSITVSKHVRLMNDKFLSQ
jgi:prepilin peptidase dependent protein B